MILIILENENRSRLWFEFKFRLKTLLIGLYFPKYLTEPLPPLAELLGSAEHQSVNAVLGNGGVGYERNNRVARERQKSKFGPGRKHDQISRKIRVLNNNVAFNRHGTRSTTRICIL